ncbi:MerR family transcriptional regulator [Neobacillus sp. OS1-2]|uniref:MerR family transcriptional regulator n=1 Tax=Neobacillus sp. OS1-2 TaxID=3070680 RepID=UPI0027DF6BB1|nr:MerR family transcriptional regulator [Neobacillus sp. OS1-2]WML42330.1 MerR family transcriptional regulator [Neobacillus sp. OS1-2]
MRIGKFAESNELSIDTIRHYMDLGIIIPEKTGGHYFFDEQCQNELEHILELKGMGFSLNEIKTIFFYKNFGKLLDYEEDSYYRTLFLDKFKKLEEEIKNLLLIKARLKLKLEHLSTKSIASTHMMGVDLRVLDFLKCLKCGETLILQDGIINRNQIMDGKLHCDCGTDYLIEAGIVKVGEQESSYMEQSFESQIQEYIQETDPVYLENLQKGLYWSKRKLDQVDLHQKVLLELGSGFGFFLRNIFKDLPEDCLYIAVDHSMEKQRFLKGLLEKTGIKRRILFICSDFLEIPIKDQSVDLIIDYTGTSNYSFHHETFLLHKVDSLVQSNGYLLGSYFAFKNFSPKSKIAAKFRDNFTVEKIKENIDMLKYKPFEERTSEYVDKGGRYEDFFVTGEEIFSYAFFGKR